MSFLEAKADGIRYVRASNGCTYYYPQCHVCGKEVSVMLYKHEISYTCQECKYLKSLAQKESGIAQSVEKKEKKFANAVKRIQRQCSNFQKYSQAVSKVHEKLHRPGWFDSTEEIMVAIELVKSNIKARHQVQLGKYRADFLLPDYKIVLEVDGYPFHNKNTRAKEKVRDELITIALGPEWEVVRIPCDRINEKVYKLIPAIRAVKKKREALRSENNGNIPPWYSKTIT